MILSQVWSLFLNPTKRAERLQFPEVLLVCWLFSFIKGIYSVISLNFSLLYKSFSFWSVPTDELSSRWFLYATLMEAIFYPVYLIFIKTLWSFVIRGFCLVANKKVSQEEIDDVLITSFTPHILLALPLVGTFFHQLLHLVYLYLGLRHKLFLSRAQSILLIFSPILILVLFWLTIIMIFAVDQP